MYSRTQMMTPMSPPIAPVTQADEFPDGDVTSALLYAGPSMSQKAFWSSKSSLHSGHCFISISPWPNTHLSKLKIFEKSSVQTMSP